MNTDHPKFMYQRAVMGGTFDRLHAAHRSLLQTAAHMAKEVFVGVVSEELGEQLFADKEKKEMIQSYEVRARNVREFMKKYTDKAEVEPLYDPWGPAPEDPRADVIVVSYETEGNGHRINQMRKENGLDSLDIVIIPWIFVDGAKISSTRLRQEEARADN